MEDYSVKVKLMPRLEDSALIITLPSGESVVMPFLAISKVDSTDAEAAAQNVIRPIDS